MRLGLTSAGLVLAGSSLLALPELPFSVWITVGVGVLAACVGLGLSVPLPQALLLALLSLGVPVAIAFAVHTGVETNAGSAYPGSRENCDPSCGVPLVGIFMLIAPGAVGVVTAAGLLRLVFKRRQRGRREDSRAAGLW